MARLFATRVIVACLGYFGFVCHGLSTDECNYGFVDNFFIPENVCQTLSINGRNQSNHASHQFRCDYSEEESSGIAYRYDNANCSGSPARVENVSDFHCCQACQSTCDTLLLAITYYQDSDDAYCNGTIDRIGTAEILGIEGCHTADTGFPFYQKVAPSFFSMQVFLEPGCAGAVFASVNFTDGVCQLATGFSTPVRLYTNASWQEGTGNGETCCNGSNSTTSTTAGAGSTESPSNSTTREPETSSTGATTTTAANTTAGAIVTGVLTAPADSTMQASETTGGSGRGTGATSTASGSTTEVNNSEAERRMVGQSMASRFVVLLACALTLFAACASV